MKIELNKQLDKEVYLVFYDAIVGGADFGQKIKNSHPTISKENYNEYIDTYYEEHFNELQNILNETQKCFNDLKEALFS